MFFFDVMLGLRGVSATIKIKFKGATLVIFGCVPRTSQTLSEINVDARAGFRRAEDLKLPVYGFRRLVEIWSY